MWRSSFRRLASVSDLVKATEAGDHRAYKRLIGSFLNSEPADLSAVVWASSAFKDSSTLLALSDKVSSFRSDAYEDAVYMLHYYFRCGHLVAVKSLLNDVISNVESIVPNLSSDAFSLLLPCISEVARYSNMHEKVSFVIAERLAKCPELIDFDSLSAIAGFLTPASFALLPRAVVEDHISDLGKNLEISSLVNLVACALEDSHDLSRSKVGSCPLSLLREAVPRFVSLAPNSLSISDMSIITQAVSELLSSMNHRSGNLSEYRNLLRSINVFSKKVASDFVARREEFLSGGLLPYRFRLFDFTSWLRLFRETKIINKQIIETISEILSISSVPPLWVAFRVSKYAHKCHWYDSEIFARLLITVKDYMATNTPSNVNPRDFNLIAPVVFFSAFAGHRGLEEISSWILADLEGTKQLMRKEEGMPTGIGMLVWASYIEKFLQMKAENEFAISEIVESIKNAKEQRKITDLILQDMNFFLGRAKFPAEWQESRFDEARISDLRNGRIADSWLEISRSLRVSIDV